MNNAQQTARVGLFFLLGLALVWATFETLNSGRFLAEEGYTVIASFDNLKELKQGDEVRMAGVRIGSVDSTRLAGRRAEALLRINSGIEIPNDAVAMISMSGLIGTNYISIDLDDALGAPLQAGAEITTRATSDLNSIMTDLGNIGGKIDSALEAITRVTGGQAGEPGMFQRLDTILRDNQTKLNDAFTNLQEISRKLNEGEGTVGRLINDPDLHDELLAAVEEIRGAASDAREFITSTQSIVEDVKTGNGTLGTLVYDDAVGNDLRTTAAQLREIAEKLNRGEGTLGRLINDDSLYLEARSTLQRADRTLEGLGDSGPISAVGSIANSLF